MKIGVCVKVTPDTDTRIKITGAGEGIDPSGIKYILSPYDAFAVEEAVQTKEKHGGEVILFTVGNSGHQTQIRGNGLAVGGDRAVIVEDDATNATDSLGIARALAAAIKAEECDIVFCGKQAIDDDNVQVPAMLAELLGWAQISVVSAFELDGNNFQAERNVGSGTVEVVRGSTPVVVTADRGLNTPRYAKLPQIMKAKRKKIAIKSLGDIGLSADDVAPAVVSNAYDLPPERPSGRIISGDNEAAVAELVRLLREEAKVI